MIVDVRKRSRPLYATFDGSIVYFTPALPGLFPYNANSSKIIVINQIVMQAEISRLSSTILHTLGLGGQPRNSEVLWTRMKAWVFKGSENYYKTHEDWLSFHVLTS